MASFSCFPVIKKCHPSCSVGRKSTQNSSAHFHSTGSWL